MGETQKAARRRTQFTIRTALLAMLLVALILGWYSAHRKNEELSWRLLRVQSEIHNAKSRAELDEEPKGKMFGKGGLSGVRLDGLNLRGLSITGGRFQIASFKNSDLRGTTLTGVIGAFRALSSTAPIWQTRRSREPAHPFNSPRSPTQTCPAPF